MTSRFSHGTYDHLSLRDGEIDSAERVDSDCARVVRLVHPACLDDRCADRLDRRLDFRRRGAHLHSHLCASLLSADMSVAHGQTPTIGEAP